MSAQLFVLVKTPSLTRGQCQLIAELVPHKQMAAFTWGLVARADGRVRGKGSVLLKTAVVPASGAMLTQWLCENTALHQQHGCRCSDMCNICWCPLSWWLIWRKAPKGGNVSLFKETCLQSQTRWHFFLLFCFFFSQLALMPFHMSVGKWNNVL